MPVRYAENLSTGEVLLVLEGEEKDILKLLEIVEKEAPSFIKVNNIQKRKDIYKGSFSDFERKERDVVELNENASTRDILIQMLGFSKSTDEKLERGIEILSTMKNQLDTSLEKQDQTISEVRKTRIELKKELGKTNTLLEERFARMENEIEKIKKALIRAGISI